MWAEWRRLIVIAAAWGATIVAAHLVLFRAGLLWAVTPDLGATVDDLAWRQTYQHARTFETAAPDPSQVLVLGSSVVQFGVSADVTNARLAAAGLPPRVGLMGVMGARATDVALLAYNARRLRPWLVFYCAVPRDFGRTAGADHPVVQTFYDSSIELPLLPRRTLHDHIDAWLKRYVALYRYRVFVRGLGSRLVSELAKRLATPAAHAAGPAASSSPRYFMPGRVPPQAVVLWERWRVSRRFEDYVAYLRASGQGDLLARYGAMSLASVGPEKNPHAVALVWMLRTLHADGIRVVVAQCPENPVTSQPDARAYDHADISRAYAAFLTRLAEEHGARFVDLRALLDAEDFYDLQHANLEGERKLSIRLAEIVAEEWRASRTEP